MTAVTSLKLPVLESTHPRKIVHHTRGLSHGPITRLVSPGDLGEVLKPFVFLDLFTLDNASFSGMGLHPHSGIATVSYLFEGSVRYEDTTGATGVLPAGGVEWFKAAHGAWHGGGAGEHGNTRGFQLWIALPPGDELGAVESIYQAADAVPQEGPARVLVGALGASASPLRPQAPLNYFAVRLGKNESWRYQPPGDHSVGWLALAKGHVFAPEKVDAGELVVFEPSNRPIEVHAVADTEFVIGTAAPHRHDLVLGRYSVHTSRETLQAGENRIGEIQRRLRSEGRL